MVYELWNAAKKYQAFTSFYFLMGVSLWILKLSAKVTVVILVNSEEI